VGKFIAGTDAVHPEIFVCSDGVTGTEAAHQQHHLFTVQTGLVFIDDGLHDRVILGNYPFHICLDSIVKALGDCAQTLSDLGRSEEVELQPGDAVLLFHHLAHIVHRAVTVNKVQFNLMGCGNLFQLAIPSPGSLDVQTDFFQQRRGCPDVAADVVIADQRDVIGAGWFGKLAGFDDVIADCVVGDMVTERLGNTTETLAVTGNDRNVKFLGGLFGNRVNIVADQADRAFGEDRDPLGERKEVNRFLQQCFQLLVAAVNDILFLEIRGELHGKLGDTVDAGHQVAPCTPGVPAAADRAVRHMDHIADRPPDNTFGSGIGAATGTHDTGDSLLVGLDTGGTGSLIINAKVRRTFFSGLLRIHGQGIIDHRLG